MKERIRELYKQALENKFDYGGGVGVKPGEYYSNYKTVLNAEKFAELIVRECIRLCDQVDLVGADDCIENIKEHFEIKK